MQELTVNAPTARAPAADEMRLSTLSMVVFARDKHDFFLDFFSFVVLVLSIRGQNQSSEG